MARKPASLSVNRETILLAAADVLRQNGYEATTMKDIAARVNLTAASLYHHFLNKDFLLLEVLRLGLEHAINRLEPIVNGTASAREKLTQMVTTHIVEITDNPAVGAAMVFEIRSLMNVRPSGAQWTQETLASFIEGRDAFFRQRDYFEKLFRNTIRNGIESGEFRAVDASIVAKAMLGAQNWVGVWYRETGRLKGADIARIMTDTFLTSLLVPEKSLP